MSERVDPAASRNVICPCGSGRRYKDCHGSLIGSSAGPAKPISPDAILAAALAAQRSGQLDEASRLYEGVLAQDPMHFDALHMLGVIHYQRSEFECARLLIARACELRPEVADARRNLSLVDGAIGQANAGMAYRAWLARSEPATHAARAPLWTAVAAGADAPRISLLLPTYNAPLRWLARCLDSVLSQAYPHWELCIADDASTDAETGKLINDYAARDARIRTTRRTRNGHISAATNSALALASSAFVGLLDQDDELAASALAEIAIEIVAHPDAVLIYSDEDKIDEEGRRFQPYFKPDWNVTLMRAQNAVSHLGVFRTDVLRAVGGFREGYEGAQDWDATLRIAEHAPDGAIRHVARILYHWRSLASSTARSMDSKGYAADAQERVVSEHCARRGFAISVSRVVYGSFLQCDPIGDTDDTVTLLVLRRPWVSGDGLAARWRRWAGAAARELVVLDIADDRDPAVGADERPVLLRADAARAVNAAVDSAAGEILVIVDGELDPRSVDGINLLVRHAQQPGVGVVGGVAFDARQRIAGSGYILDPVAIAGSPYVGKPWGFVAMGGRNLVPQEMSAVRLDCFAVRRAVWEQLGGLDPRLRRAFHDVDFCLRAARAGLRQVWHPAVMFAWPRPLRADFLGEACRDADRADADTMRQRWNDALMRDAAYNPNLAAVPRLFEFAEGRR